MTRVLPILLLLLLAVCAFGQKAGKQPSVLGSWTFDPATIPVDMKARNIVMTFKRDGKYTMKGLKLTSEGTYSIAKGKIYLIPATANGKKVPAGKGEAVGEFAERGMAILIDAEKVKNGKPVKYRLVRKR